MFTAMWRSRRRPQVGDVVGHVQLGYDQEGLPALVGYDLSSSVSIGPEPSGLTEEHLQFAYGLAIEMAGYLDMVERLARLQGLDPQAAYAAVIAVQER